MESGFVWIDDSTSSYRKWGTSVVTYPTSSGHCVRHRYHNAASVLSQGWLNAPCDDVRNCYFCSKSGK